MSNKSSWEFYCENCGNPFKHDVETCNDCGSMDIAPLETIDD